MKIRTLSENTSISESIGHEHGLSLYIETEKHKLLFDTGGSDLFAQNAQKMGAELEEIDTVVISHGHYDHGGGLRAFLELNKKAEIFLQEKAFDEHFANSTNGVKKYIGLDMNLLPMNASILSMMSFRLTRNCICILKSRAISLFLPVIRIYS